MATARPDLGPDYWETRYREGRTGWERGVPTPAFVRLLESSRAPRPGRMAVPGCGRGHDALLFATAGHQVHGIDVAPTAVADALAMADRAGVTDRATFEVGNVLDIGQRYPHSFDYVLERACFCALDPSVRDAYLASIALALRPGGRLIGSFFVGTPAGGPPFAVPWEDIMASLAPWFDVEEQDDARAEGLMSGTDLFAILRRKT